MPLLLAEFRHLSPRVSLQAREHCVAGKRFGIHEPGIWNHPPEGILRTFAEFTPPEFLQRFEPEESEPEFFFESGLERRRDR